MHDDVLARALEADRRRHAYRQLGRLGRPGRWLRRRMHYRRACASAAADGRQFPAWRDQWDRRGTDR